MKNIETTLLSHVECEEPGLKKFNYNRLNDIYVFKYFYFETLGIKQNNSRMITRSFEENEKIIRKQWQKYSFVISNSTNYVNTLSKIPKQTPKDIQNKIQ